MSNAFDDYKDEVIYDYILLGKMPYKLESDIKNYEPDFDQQSEAITQLEKQIENLLNNEDYLKDCFKKVGRGRVYAKLDKLDDELEILFGISKKEQEEEFNKEDIIEYIKLFLNDFDSDLDGVRVAGFGSENEEDSTEPCTIYLKRDGEVKVENKSKTENKICYEDIDRKLVLENKLTFIKENNTINIKLSDEGKIEQYQENKLLSSKPFSKSTLVRECKLLEEKGYSLLQEELPSDNKEKFDPEQTKKDLEQNIKDVDELQKLKDTLDDKVDTLMNESIDNISDFPSSEFSDKKIASIDFTDLSFESDLTDEQKEWIQTNLDISIEELQEAMEQLINVLAVNDPVISIDEYIRFLLNADEDTANLE